MNRFNEVWTETVQRVHAELAETEVIRFTTPDGSTVWAGFVILDIVMPLNDVLRLTVCGITENGRQVEVEFDEGFDDYPDEIAPLIPILIEAAIQGADEKLLTTGDVARELCVSKTQVTKWDKSGLLEAAFRSPGGHRRYRVADVARFRDSLPARSWREDVSTEEITRLRDVQHLSWRAIGEKFGMTGEGVRRRYNRTRRKSHSRTPPATG